MYKKTKGIVIYNCNWREKDKLITFYTQDFGKIRGKAKGVRKIGSRYGASFEPFSYLEIMLYQSGNQDIYTITGCRILNSFQQLRRTPQTYAKVCTFIEVLEKLTIYHQSEKEIFQLLIETLSNFEKYNFKLLFSFFLLHLLSYSGYQLSFNSCVVCGGNFSDTGWGLNLKEGGIICSNCRKDNSLQLRDSVVKYLEKLETMDIEKLKILSISELDLRDIEKVSQIIINYFIPSELKSFQVLEQIGDGD